MQTARDDSCKYLHTLSRVEHFEDEIDLENIGSHRRLKSTALQLSRTDRTVSQKWLAGTCSHDESLVPLNNAPEFTLCHSTHALGRRPQLEIRCRNKSAF